ncbi:ornithine carbamoyltransferase [Saccharopolyspora subtropica]|uniref:Ornithine carbamoyltransferase n=1 Tax=Saccharopolyspora thermophila TaxID=89367 RepID=A0A917JVT9_9PSEU|nr:ornithine carbamoyltransferase [Saccharopolyspora subtropica]GGI84115.1 ornithine carbamoyltransferase [Saccharopolyspora subtropica]
MAAPSASRGPVRGDLISLADLGLGEIREIVQRGVEFSRGERSAEPLAGAVVGIYFRKTSTRTRTAFSAAALRLGARIISYGPGDLQLNTGETIEDTAQVLSRMLDGLVCRTAGSTEELRALAEPPGMAVINAMSAHEHPTQALTDLTTIQRHLGGIDGIRVLYVGEGNSTAVALALSLTRFERTELHLRTPPGYGLAPAVREQAERYAAESGSVLRETHDMAELPSDVDIVYTTRWQTTGTTKPDPDWRRTFAPFQVNEQLLDGYPNAWFMHDLPAHRGEETTAAVLDGPRSIAFDQAGDKMHSAMAVLEWAL